MATTTRLVTTDELMAMGGDARYELWEGVLKEVSPSRVKTGVISVRLSSAILAHVESHGLGYVTDAETGYILTTNPPYGCCPGCRIFSTGPVP